MSERAILTVQQGVWIDSRQLADAGLHAPLEIAVQPGEIRIRSASPSTPAPSADDPLLGLAGVLSGPSLCGQQIEQELYGSEASDR